MQVKNKIIKLFAQLTPQEQKGLLKALGESKLRPREKTAKEKITSCPTCKSNSICKNGKHKKVQRYLCKNCGKTFTGKTGTLIHGVQDQAKFDKYLKLMLEGYYSIKKMAALVEISYQTAFDWRHRILTSFKRTPDEFKGITEIDDVWFLYSQKGRKGLKFKRKRGGSNRKGDNEFQAKVLITADRSKESDLSLVKIGRIAKEDIDGVLDGKFHPDSTLVSDKHRSISAFAKSQGLRHKRFLSKKHSAGKEFHIQSVNQMASRLKGILNHQLRGVSTKHLQNYTNWIQFNEIGKDKQPAYKVLKQELMNNKDVWDKFTSAESRYKTFLKKKSTRTYRCPTKRKWKTSILNLKLSA